MSASIVQISVSRGGVPKRAIPEAEVTAPGIAGDAFAHPEIHGGPQQALLIVTSEGIAELVAQGFPLYAGALGENITTIGLDRRTLRSGQRYRVGQAIVELTKLRAPCSTLSVYNDPSRPFGAIQRAIYDVQIDSGDPSSPRWGLGGFYASVDRSGVIRPGDPIEFLDQRV